ncbi:hypothetical protein EVAR_21133_1 [Eumeta japonica]|uniref:VWFA domain-containing protein n=1 Tax=Eumeta variegata TaxID=151549 RepID=A0A4C1VV97_EUMVA|nr:hypothetical protein EVAR_21133_1 [Eumeta japonica]
MMERKRGRRPPELSLTERKARAKASTSSVSARMSSARVDIRFIPFRTSSDHAVDRDPDLVSAFDSNPGLERYSSSVRNIVYESSSPMDILQRNHHCVSGQLDTNKLSDEGGSDPMESVKSWARDLGNELWKLNEVLTNTSAIRHKYKQMNAGVKQKNGIEILESAVESVSTMLTGKINAVKCIHATAEEMAREFNYSLIKDKMYKEDYQYCSAKYSVFHYEDGSNSSIEDLPKFATNNSHYQYVDLEKDSHFYDIPITTSTSCVQVPTNIYDGETEALNAILWSKRLNDIFIKNYNTDPSLAWQYFGSSKGVFRFYPGMPWQKGTDTYDCRVKSWYIEAATCSKDVIILFDVSGSMTGFKNYVARTTLSAILDTLSNNDYINVYAFKKDKVMEVVDCFVDLVQATPENIKTLNDALTPDEHNKHKIPLEGNATLSLAYIKAFETLRQRREGKCAVDSQTGCNQMVMLITDYVPGNLTEVFEEHNRETINGTVYIPVRVFTYLIGKEVTNVREIMWMGCLNRGESNAFSITKLRGVRQGCIALPWLFNLFMDSCLYHVKEYECGLRMDELSAKCLLYTDDQVILAPSVCGLHEMAKKMNDSVKKRSMKVKVGNTKVMVFERGENTTECDILIEGEKVEQVKEFVYLRSQFTNDGKHGRDIEKGVDEGNKVLL